MLLLTLTALLAMILPEFDQLLTAFLAVALLIEVLVCAAAWRGRNGRAGTWVGSLALEELGVISCLGGPYLDGLAGGWRLGIICAGIGLGAALVLRAPLPEALFPVKGLWLRKLLGACVLGAL